MVSAARAVRLLGLSSLALGVGIVPAGCKQSPIPEPKPLVYGEGDQKVAFVQGSNEPLVVDWQPDQRGDLEVSMRQGVAIVAYDKQGLRLLRDCRIDGSYGFFGINTKEQLVRLETAEELRANLPTFGGLLAAKIGGELSQGGTLDVALVMIGKLRTTWRKAGRADLAGDCATATHFVRGATIGAFAMDQGTKRSARVAASLFDVGADAAASRSKQVRNTDGSLDACKTHDPDAPKAPKQCGALLRIELTEIAAAAEAPVAVPAKEAEGKALVAAEKCPRPLVFVDGKCSAEAKAAPHDCTFGNGAECVGECQKGSLESCVRLSQMKLLGRGVPLDLRGGAELAAQSCERGHGRACAVVAEVFMADDRVAHDLPRAGEFAKKSCRLGDEIGCLQFGQALKAGFGMKADASMAAQAFTKSCNGGVEGACSELGLLFERGDGVPRDDGKAALLHKRACDGSEMVGCVNYGLSLEFGSGVRADVPLAAKFYERACNGENAYCIQMGAITLAGNGVKADRKRAADFFRKSCGRGHPVSCSYLSAFEGERHPLDNVAVQQYLALYGAGCRANVARDCTGLAILGAANGIEKAKTDPLFDRGCTAGDKWACTLKTAR